MPQWIFYFSLSWFIPSEGEPTQWWIWIKPGFSLLTLPQVSKWVPSGRSVNQMSSTIFPKLCSTLWMPTESGHTLILWCWIRTIALTKPCLWNLSIWNLGLITLLTCNLQLFKWSFPDCYRLGRTLSSSGWLYKDQIMYDSILIF